MIEFRTFQCLDKGAPRERKYLTLAVAPGGFSLTFYAPSAAEAQDSASAWLAQERKRREAEGLRTRTVPPKTQKPARGASSANPESAG